MARTQTPDSLVIKENSDSDNEHNINQITFFRGVDMRQEASHVIANLHRAVKHALSNSKGQALTLELIAPLKQLCNGIYSHHLGLEVAQPGDIHSEIVHRSPIGYQHICEDDSLTMGIFVLPPGAKIPLHNHPHMSVISRLLYGSLNIRAFDFVQEDQVLINGRKGTDWSSRTKKRYQKGRWARMQMEKKVQAPHTTELLPSFCNIHEFTAGKDIGCAILDIITPPYNPSYGRDCTYYRLVDEGRNEFEGKNEQLYLLNAYDPPSDFMVLSMPYKGPPIINE